MDTLTQHKDPLETALLIALRLNTEAHGWKEIEEAMELTPIELRELSMDMACSLLNEFEEVYHFKAHEQKKRQRAFLSRALRSGATDLPALTQMMVDIVGDSRVSLTAAMVRAAAHLFDSGIEGNEAVWNVSRKYARAAKLNSLL